MDEIFFEKEEYINFIRSRITELRIKKNVSEYQMSYDLGKSKGYIQSISSGATMPSMDAFIDICGYFNITPIEFFDKKIKNTEKIQQVMDLIKELPENDLDILLKMLIRFNELTQKQHQT